MTPDKVREAFDACATLIREEYDEEVYGALPVARFTAPRPAQNDKDLLSHALWMCEEGKDLVNAGRIEKAMRWLGFVQGVMWGALSITIDELKRMNMPDEKADAP